MPWPSTLSAFTDPLPNQFLNSPSHSSIESSQNTGIEEVQAFVGTLSSVQGTLMYDIRAAASNGGGHVQTANKGGTGQTSYNKGDILAAQSTSVLGKLSIGSDGAVLTADSTQSAGIRWVGATAATVTSFLSSGTWTKSTAMKFALIEAWGGGGSGASRTSTSDAAGGGGGGAYNYIILPSSMLSSTELAMVGAGGTGVTGNTNGNVGGVTVFGASSLLTAYGGGGGGGGAAVGGGGGGGGTTGAGASSMSGYLVW